MRFSHSLRNWSVCAAAWLGVALLGVGGTAMAEPAAMVFINGTPTPVFFNDGDSFRVTEGSLSGAKTRLAGFNTLESHGPVHQWGNWHFKELYANAKMATLNARRGVWHCQSKDMKRDGYGRILLHCLDLGEDQIRNGFAHAMSISDAPADPRLLKAQHEAMRHRRGMWAKGIPTYILTSLHSAAEGHENNYNRLVNTVDGHSKQWHHQNAYDECENVCYQPTELPLEEAFAVVRELRADSILRPVLEGIDDMLIALSVNTFIQNNMVPKIFGKHNDLVLKKMTTMKAAGRFADAKRMKGSCSIYVSFERKYATPKPGCLKW